jgi:hypothetical protein
MIAGPEQKADARNWHEDRGVPEGPGREAVVEERRHGMNAHGPGDGEDDERPDDRHLVLLADGEAVEHVERDDRVDRQVPVQDHHVPGKKR